jgi:hypothetical protein
MMQVLAVTKHTLCAGGVWGYFAYVVMFFACGALGAGNLIWELQQARILPDAERIARLTIELFTLPTTLTFYFLMYLAAFAGKSFSDEVSQRTAYVTLTKISRTKFCLGVFLAKLLVVSFFGVMLCCVAGGLAYFLSLELGALFFLGAAQKITLAYAITALSLMVGAVFPVSSMIEGYSEAECKSSGEFYRGL